MTDSTAINTLGGSADIDRLTVLAHMPDFSTTGRCHTADKSRDTNYIKILLTARCLQIKAYTSVRGTYNRLATGDNCTGDRVGNLLLGMHLT